MVDLNNRVALVTGGARDIGRAVSLRLARQGAPVCLNYYDNPDDARATLKEIESFGGRATIVQADVTKSVEVDRLVSECREKFGPAIHILVNVAGGLVARKKIEEMDEAFWDFVHALNAKSVFLMTRAVVPFMPEGGAIVNFATQAVRDGGGPGASAYASSKAAVLTFTRSMAKELGPRKIRVNAVAPGMINTTFHNVFTKPEVRQAVAAGTPLRREGEAQEVADLVAYLASSNASFITGTGIDINGGTFFS
jgi:3-oxoacyl-[acyl-carrier protein] reductase